MSAAGNSTTAARRVVGRPWVKGQSGNPRCRPSTDFEVERLCRAHTVAAVNALIRTLKDQRTRVTAAMGILAYAYGRPQAANDTGPVEDETVTFVLKIVWLTVSIRIKWIEWSTPRDHTPGTSQ